MNNLGIVIGLIGGAGAGKDSLADFLGRTFATAKLGFADELKRLVAGVYGYDYTRLGDLEYKEQVSGHTVEPSRSLAAFMLTDQGVPVSPENVDHLAGVLERCTPDITRRRVLQLIGTEGFRAIDEAHWVNRALLKASEAMEAGAQAVVFADVRFMNEAAAIRALDEGYLWRIRRTDMDSAATGDDAQAHASERELDRIVPHVTLKAAFGELPLLYAQGRVLADSIGLGEWPAS